MRSTNSRRTLLAAGMLATGLAAVTPALADGRSDDDRSRKPIAAVVPIIVGFFNGKEAPYLATDASDRGVAKLYGANYSATLGFAANTDAVDDIYAVANFSQGNIIPSHPAPAGPNNLDPQYTPLWQITMVTWADPTKARVLKSEEEVLLARDQGLVTLNKTNIVVNCSVIYTPSGGELPNTRLLYRDSDDR